MSTNREPSWTDAAAGPPWASLAQGMFQLPVTLMTYGIEIVTATLRGAFRLAEDSMAGMAGAAAEAGSTARSAVHREERQTGAREARDPIDRKEDRQMADTNLADENVKLVRYTIVFVKRDQEEILEQDEILVTDDLTPEGFASWRIAVYFQGDHEPIDHADKKYLRVCYEVICRWVREPLHYEKRQLDELKGIREAIEGKG
ncbi:MAG TPA: hypothetical protein VLA75_09265 [Thermoanaerobaculia bacterium]|nr:hypothetical protein [Thermoanaerobaculia bacterium]